MVPKDFHVQGNLLKVHRSPLEFSAPFVDTGFNICNNYNLMTAIKLHNDSMSESAQNISYQIGKFQGTSTAFTYFMTQLVNSGFLVFDHILICDNVTIHVTRENENLADILWEEKKY